MVTTPNDPGLARTDEPMDLALRTDAAGDGTLARIERPARRGAPLPVAAAVAALWAVVLGHVPLVILAAIGGFGQTSLVGVFRIATSTWLLGHGVPIHTPTDRITLVPLGVAVLVGWRLVRAGVHVSRATGAHRVRSVWPAVRAGACVAVVYAGLGVLLARLSSSGAMAAALSRTGIGLLVVAGTAAIAGALAHGRASRLLLNRAPRLLTDALRTGLTAAAFLLAAGAAASGTALALAGGDATAMLSSYGAGVAGQAGITAICLVYLPNLAVWGTAYLLGPGFAVGEGTVVSPGDVLLGPVPGLPVFAGLPTVPLTGLGPALLGVPLVAGLAAGWLLTRRRTGGWSALLGPAALAGPVAGVAVQLVAYASAGALGQGRLSTMGPVDWRVGLFAAGVTCVGAVAGAAAARTLAAPAEARR